MLWLFVLLAIVCLTLPLSNDSPSKDVNLYRYGSFIQQYKIKNVDKYKNL